MIEQVGMLPSREKKPPSGPGGLVAGCGRCCGVSSIHRQPADVAADLLPSQRLINPDHNGDDGDFFAFRGLLRVENEGGGPALVVGLGR